MVGTSTGNVSISLQQQGVSGVHALIEVSYDGQDHFVEDLDSTNGTLIGELSLLPKRLYQVTDGKILTFGPTRCIYRIVDSFKNPPVANNQDLQSSCFNEVCLILNTFFGHIETLKLPSFNIRLLKHPLRT